MPEIFGDILEYFGIPAWSFWVVAIGVGGLILNNTSLWPKITTWWQSGRVAGVSQSTGSTRLERLLQDHNDFVRADNDAGAAKMMEAIKALKAEPPVAEVANAQQK